MNIAEVVTQTPQTSVLDIDISPNISDTPLQKTADNVASVSSNALSGINWTNILRYGLIILILAFLGFNLFSTLGKATDMTSGFLQPFLSFFGYNIGETVKQTTNTVADGAKLGIDVASGTIDDAVTLLEKSVGVKDVQFNRIDKENDTLSIRKALDNSVKLKSNRSPEPDDAGSTTQRSNNSNKAGYCYIGEDRGFRTCIRVGEGDKCMSGDIFPRQNICVNPNLRE